MERIPELQTFVDKLSKKAFGESNTECEKKKICVICHKQITGFRDETSKREYEISGMCQRCQDEIFGDGQ